MEDEYKKVINEFYEIYRPLQKKYNLRIHESFRLSSKFDADIEGKIEIWKYEGEQRKKLICNVSENDIVECYKKAINDLKFFEKERKEIPHNANLAS